MFARRGFFITIIFLISFYGIADFTQSEVQCKDYEMPKDNPDDCVSDCCPIGDDVPCPNPCPQGPCRCSLLSSRALNGTCIPTIQCPPYPCGINEKYDPCPVCSEMCANAVASGERCHSKFRIGTTVICKPKCRCIDNYWRDENNFCVPYSECPQFQSGGCQNGK